MTDTNETETPAEESQNAPDRTLSWDDIELSAAIRAGVDGKGYTNPTPVQSEAIPPALEGHDLLVRSKTGSGKTAAFMIPTLDRIPAGYGKAGCVVMCPTRELAIQVAEEADELCKEKNLRIVRVYGGVAIGPQADALNAGAEVIIGTPGRIRDHIRRGNLDLSTALVGCLDEADEMLSMGFFEEVTSILDELPKTVQILLFSATVEAQLKDLIGRYLKDPKEIYISIDNEQANKNIHHVLYETTLEYPKPRQLLYVMEKEDPESSIVFCNTRSDTETVARFLNRQGLAAEPISSDLTQKARERVMRRIKAGEIDVMVATDIAARGSLRAPHRPHRPHRQEGHRRLVHERQGPPVPQDPRGQVRHRLRGARAAHPRGGRAPLDEPRPAGDDRDHGGGHAVRGLPRHGASHP